MKNIDKQYCAVVGNPISHSLSPTIFSFWFQKYGLNAQYLSFSLKKEDFKTVLTSLPLMNFVGVNVTMPFKEVAFESVNQKDEFSNLCQSVNAISFFEDNIKYGMNTDGIGFIKALEKNNIVQELSKQKILVLGAGGASKSICTSLLKRNVASLTISNRTAEKAKGLVYYLKKHFPHASIVFLDWESKENGFSTFDGLVNTTCLGMKGYPPLDITFHDMNKNMWIYDIVYNPLKTPLLLAAQEKRLYIMDGLDMLIFQAYPCFESWFGFQPGFYSELRQKLESCL